MLVKYLSVLMLVFFTNQHFPEIREFNGSTKLSKEQKKEFAEDLKGYEDLFQKPEESIDHISIYSEACKNEYIKDPEISKKRICSVKKYILKLYPNLKNTNFVEKMDTVPSYFNHSCEESMVRVGFTITEEWYFKTKNG